jgi:hypothetical protein
MLRRIWANLSKNEQQKIAIRRMERKAGFIVPGLMNQFNCIVMRMVPVKVQYYRNI